MARGNGGINVSATPAERPDRNTSRKLDAVVVIYLTVPDPPMIYMFDRWRWSFAWPPFWKYPNSSGKSGCNQAV